MAIVGVAATQLTCCTYSVDPRDLAYYIIQNMNGGTNTDEQCISEEEALWIMEEISRICKDCNAAPGTTYSGARLSNQNKSGEI